MWTNWNVCNFFNIHNWAHRNVSIHGIKAKRKKLQTNNYSLSFFARHVPYVGIRYSVPYSMSVPSLKNWSKLIFWKIQEKMFTKSKLSTIFRQKYKQRRTFDNLLSKSWGNRVSKTIKWFLFRITIIFTHYIKRKRIEKLPVDIPSEERGCLENALQHS